MSRGFWDFFSTPQFCRSARRNWRAQLPRDFPDESLGNLGGNLRNLPENTEKKSAREMVARYIMPHVLAIRSVAWVRASCYGAELRELLNHVPRFSVQF